MTTDKSDILRKLEELMAMDNSDKEYLVDALLKNSEIRQTVKDKLSKTVSATINDNNSTIVSNAIEKLIKQEFQTYINTQKEDFQSSIQLHIDQIRKEAYDLARKQAEEFSKSVEKELQSVLATEVAAQLFEILSTKHQK